MPWPGRVGDQLMAVGVSGGLGAVGDAGLVEDALEVEGDGVLADDECLGDLAVRLAGRDQPQHLDLALGQPIGE